MKNDIKKQLKVVKDKYNSLLEECKALDELTKNEKSELRFAVRVLVIDMMTNTKKLIIEVDPQLEFTEIEEKSIDLSDEEIKKFSDFKIGL